MPTNVTPEYERAERRYREATDDGLRMEALREMLSTVPKHKGTEKLQADIKRRISRLRKAEAKTGGAGRSVDPFHVPRGGAGQVVLVGEPNVGKSSIVAATTNAPVKVAEYPYATALPTPGMATCRDAQIELVDTPPVTVDHVPPGLMGTIRAADMICIVVSAAGNPLEEADATSRVLTDRGLVLLTAPRNQLPDDRNTRTTVIAATHADAPGAEATVATLRELCAPLGVVAVDCHADSGAAALIDELWRLLALVRVYTKVPGHDADMSNPFTLEIGSTVEDLAREIHRELPEKMKSARIWGDGHHDGQKVHRTEPLTDGDIVEIHE